MTTRAEAALMDGVNDALKAYARSQQELKFWKSRAEGYRDALAELAGSVPMDDYMKRVGSDHPLAQALAQAYLVLKEGPQ